MPTPACSTISSPNSTGSFLSRVPTSIRREIQPPTSNPPWLVLPRRSSSRTGAWPWEPGRACISANSTARAPAKYGSKSSRDKILFTAENAENKIVWASCKTLESERRSSFRASEARPGIQDFQAILDSGFRRNDGGDDFCKKLFRFSRSSAASACSAVKQDYDSSGSSRSYPPPRSSDINREGRWNDSLPPRSAANLG